MFQPRLRSRAIAAASLVVSCLALSACSPRVDLKEALQVTDVSTGWFDVGVVDGKNKLVPSISFRLINTADADLDAVGLNVVFRLADNEEIHEEIFKQRVPFDNKQTELIIVRSQNGFTGDPPQTRLEMLQHSQFRDMDVVIMARQTSAQWVELHRVRVERTLLTR
jgi:hypothetical protein